MFRRITQGYLICTRRFWVLILLVSGLLAVPGLKATVSLFKNIDTDLVRLLPEDYSSVQLIEKVRKKLTHEGSLKVIIEGPSREVILPFLLELKEHFEVLPEVKRVDHVKPGYEFFDEHKMLYVSLEDLNDIRDRIDRKIQREKLGSLYISFEEDEPQTFDEILEKYKGEYSTGVRSPYYESDDGTLFLLIVEPLGSANDLAYARKFLRLIQHETENFQTSSRDPSLKTYYAGLVRTRVNEYDSLLSDLSMAGTVAVIGVLLLLVIVFRGVRPILLVLLPLCFGILFTFGIARLFLDHLNTVTAFMFAIMTGLGIDFGIHSITRYLRERNAGHSVDQSLFAVNYHIGRAGATAAATTSIAFLLLIFVDFKGFSEFGFIAGQGIITIFLTYWFLLPAWIILLEKLGPMKQAPLRFFGFTRGRVQHHFPRPRLIFFGAIGLTVLSLLVATRIDFEYDYGKLDTPLPEYEATRVKYEKIIKRQPRPAVLILKDEEEANAIKKAIAEMSTNPASVADRFASLYSLVPDQQTEKLAVISEIQTLLEDDVIQKLVKGEDKKRLEEFEEALAVKSVTMAQVPEEAQELFLGTAAFPGTLGFIFPRTGMELGDGKTAIQFAREVQFLETEAGRFEASSDSIIFANVLTIMLEETRVAIPLAFFGVLLFLILDLRKWRDVAAVVIPWVSGVLWMAAAMVLFDLQLNFYNVFIPAAIFGMGIDYSVHLFHCYREERTHVMPALRSAGTAIATAALTTMVGFSGLVVASHRGLQSMGILAVIGIGLCMVCSLTMLPAGLEIWHVGRKHETGGRRQEA